MKTLDQIREAVRTGRESQCLDGRDFSRLTRYFPVEEWPLFGFKLKDGVAAKATKAYTQENILKELCGDVAFGFQKALDRRGISSELMYEVVKMWLWVLDDPLHDFPDDLYAMYGLPLFKAVSLKYGFPNPIGSDSGSEDKYEE